MNSLLRLWLCLGLILACLTASAEPTGGSMDVRWNNGAADCDKTPQPPLQVYRYDAQTFILRESPCVTFEAPFMYLLIGTKRALLIDSGDVADSQKAPLADTVMQLLPGSAEAKLPLLIVHTHGHLDHRSGDVQFARMANVQIVATDLAHVKQFFGFDAWPSGVSHLELGDRTVDVLPTPGHYVSHVSYYDRTTTLFFSGDFLLPGRLIIENKDEDLASAYRAADFVRNLPVAYVLGGHIELNAQGDTFDFGSNYHPNEHVLQLTKQDLLDLPAIVATFNGFYTQHGMYVMFNQYRLLAAEAAIALLVIACIVALIWRYVRRRKQLVSQHAAALSL